MTDAGGVRARGCAPESPRLLPPDLRPRLRTAPVLSEALVVGPARLPARTRDERRLARIDRKVAERDHPPTA